MISIKLKKKNNISSIQLLLNTSSKLMGNFNKEKNDDLTTGLYFNYKLNVNTLFSTYSSMTITLRPLKSDDFVFFFR